MKKKIKIILIQIGLFFFISCNQFYKAGNLISLDYPIETPLRSKLVRRYCDTLKKQDHKVPKYWVDIDKSDALDSIDNVRIYFKNNPEEMYLVSFSGMLQIIDVYNPEIRKNQWVARRELMSKEQEERVIKRFKEEILNKIEAMAKRDGLQDSIIYK